MAEKLGLMYIIEIVMYYLVYYLIYGRWIKRYWIPLFGLLTYYILVFTGVISDSLTSIVMTNLFAAATVFILPRVDMRQRIISAFMLIFVFSCVFNFMFTVADGISFFDRRKMLLSGSLSEYKAPTLGEKCYTILLVQLILVLCIIGFKRYISDNIKEKLYSILQKKFVLIFLFSGLLMTFTISGVDWIRDDLSGSGAVEVIIGMPGGKGIWFYILSLVASALFHLCLCVWGMFTIYTDSINKKMEHMIDNEKALGRMQKSYYDALLEKEADTRKYRHDMINHMICLDEMVKNEKYDEVRTYIRDMCDGLNNIRNKTYSVGNDIIDILTNHYVNLVDEETKVSVTGLMTCDIDSMKLCTIYSNLLQNAVEELAKCEGERLLDISFTQGGKYIKISISNSLSEENDEELHTSILSTSVLRMKSFKSTKKDKGNHGLGLKNVKKTIEDMNGRFEVSKDNGLFRVNVYLKT